LVCCPGGLRSVGAAPFREFLAHVLRDGGVAVDDYSDHCWTLQEIGSGEKFDGLGFFDFRTHYKMNHQSQ
jgi:hypothetical protein